MGLGDWFRYGAIFHDGVISKNASGWLEVRGHMSSDLVKRTMFDVPNWWGPIVSECRKLPIAKTNVVVVGNESIKSLPKALDYLQKIGTERDFHDLIPNIHLQFTPRRKRTKNGFMRSYIFNITKLKKFKISIQVGSGYTNTWSTRTELTQVVLQFEENFKSAGK